MIKWELIQLIQSLSGAEKRGFKLNCKKQAGKREFIDLFDIINRSPRTDIRLIQKQFQTLHPGKSVENAARYLMKTLTDALVQIRAGNDKGFQQYHCIMRAKVLFERSLPAAGYHELKKAQAISKEIQDHVMHYLSQRLELNYLSENGFPGMTDQELAGRQTKARSLLRLQRQIQEHYSLYELLEYRLVHSGRSLSDEDRKKLNDLVISEMSLITRGGGHSFEAQKLHLMFQSFFFTHTGEYPSSLKTFTRLNKLFEDHEFIWGQPPYDYLTSLEGILDSLRTIGHYEEMDYYIGKVEQLSREKHTEHFQAIARQIVQIYRLAILVHQQKFEEAIQLIDSIDTTLLKKPGIVDYERLAEWLFYAGLTFFHLGNWKKAGKYTSLIEPPSHHHSAIYKASRLLHILVHYELDDLDYLDYEIRSYKRTFRKRSPALKTEQLVFKLVKSDPERNSLPRNRQLWKTIQPLIGKIKEDKYEKQLLKYYDFCTWAENKLTRSGTARK